MSTAVRHLPTRATLATRRPTSALAVGLALLWLLAAVPPAAAHTDLVASTPSAGASLARAPREVTLTFQEEVSSALSAVSLQVSGGRAAPLKVSPGPDRNTVVATVDTQAATAPGATRWTVRYRVTSGDGHPIAGELTFSVRRPPAPAPAGAGPTPTAEQSSTASSNTADAPEEPSRTSIGVVAVLAAALLALLGIAARRVRRSRA